MHEYTIPSVKAEPGSIRTKSVPRHQRMPFPPTHHFPPLNDQPPDLGYDAAESYGISYKARGLCADLTNLDIYDDDNGLDYGVTGNIKGSELHHNVRPGSYGRYLAPYLKNYGMGVRFGFVLHWLGGHSRE